MRSLLIWLPLLLIIYMEQIQANHKIHSNPLKQRSDDEFDVGTPVASMDLSKNVHKRLCKCKVHGRWEEKHPCLCAKFGRRRNRRLNWKKLCQGMNKKHSKKCPFQKKQRKHSPIVPI